MKHVFSFLLFCLAFYASAQPAYLNSSRSALNPELYPFYHGVASGDPLADRVILWTRITLDPALDPVSVSWEMSTDTSFNTIVANGTVTTDSSKDYTIKADASGLQQNTWYYYRFAYDTFHSIIGRTRTLPTGTVNNLRFAVTSCQDYQDGYYNAHRDLSRRNDIDAVLFLGDYTYEGGANVNVVGDRFHEPNHKTIVLSDYRIRQSLYHLDPDLQAAHQQYPWICVWDDHETANNSYATGAKNHNFPADGNWFDRKASAVQAYHEWLPIRVPDPNDTFKIFRRFTWGNLADLNMIDTRLYDRDKQVAPSGTQFVSATDSVLLDSTRNMLGPVQMNWLKNNLDSSAAQWQLIGQQVIMTPLIVPAGLQPTPFLINPDQWDGYPYDRERFYRHILQHNIQNVVVLTGDIHTSWANDLPLANYDTSNRQNSAGVEFVCSSITSGNELDPLITAQLILNLAPHVRHVDLTQHGYNILDITPARTQNDFVYVSNVTTPNFTSATPVSWYVNNGERFLRQGSGASVALNSYPPLAPVVSGITSVKNVSNNLTTVSIHPNPFYDEVVIQYNAFKSEEVKLEVYNALGQQMLQQNLGRVPAGLNYAVFNGNGFPAGYYRVKLSGQTASKGEALIKIK